METIDAQIFIRRDTAAGLAPVVPADGEPVYEKDTKLQRIGDGVTPVAELDAAAWVDGETHEFSDDVKTALARSFITLRVAAKNPDLLIVGSITRNADGVVTSAAVVWPDGTLGTLTTDVLDPSGAINGYHLTYGSPTAKTFTQPTITRDSSGAAISIPQIVVS
ncbi:hypothetical protein [Curtobacterium sp. MCBA15_012]|uniref:hyaluronate lyase N-terminal domain-containing protein n=1 Tax=Curtobacterium sp. MCBA15_012 TaxID=1898738 RepID=UPI0008DD8AA1|nr:hypothetical protein [Curtobacterium sp. MCBA15_012]WIA99758.1 hypothetical protein QOL15_14785 [Curtobacterium sp. MCBA15_012]